MSQGRRYGFPEGTIFCCVPAEELHVRVSGVCITPVSLLRQDGMHLAVAKDEVSLFPDRTIWGLLVADTSRKGRYWQRHLPEDPMPTEAQNVHIVRQRKNGNVRFARPDQWLSGWEPAETEVAAREVVRRYVAAYGPATREEFARWFGMTSPAQARRLIDSLGEEVAPVEVEGSHAWMLAEHVPEAEKAEPSGVVRLLPAFDQYVVAAPRDREAVLPEVLKRRVYRPQGWLSPVVVVDGRMEGLWRHERKGDGLVVEIEPFTEQPEWVRRAAEEEAERLTRLLGGELEFGWSNS
jgi:hypothetical protein